MLLCGLGMGLMLAYMSARLLHTLLYGVTVHDPCDGARPMDDDGRDPDANGGWASCGICTGATGCQREPDGSPAQRMKAGLQTHGIVSSLPMFFLATLIMICTGCIHPKTQIRGTYTVENEAGLPFLVPSLDSLHLEGNTETVLISLKDGPLRRMTGEHCSVASAFFSLFPRSGGPGQWQFRSLTASA
jgi:hypothetical protein